MNNTLKQISSELCKPVLAGLKDVPKSHVFSQTYGKPSLITAMYHVLGFDGKKLERVANVNETALKKYCVLLVRPFYHQLHVTIFVNRGKQWEKFGHINKHRTEFESAFQPLAFKLLPNHSGWVSATHQTGIVKLKPPTVDVLPSMGSIIRRFTCLAVSGELGEFVLDTLDGMTRSGDLPTYIRAAMSVMHFVPRQPDENWVLTSDIEGATVRFEFEMHDGKPPVPQHLKDNAKISEQLKKIREVPTDDYAAFYDIVMLRALKNTLVIIPYSSWKPHSIELICEENVHGDIHVNAYLVSKDTKGKPKYIRVYGSIKVNK